MIKLAVIDQCFGDGSQFEQLGKGFVGLFGSGQGLTPEEAKKVLPIGSPAHVRGIVEQYAALGVTQIIMMTQGPWKRDIYQRINDEVVAAFA